MEKTINAVFEGGGVIGIGHVGAAAELEKAGYKFKRLAGTSAGAIMAALLAAGYSAEEIKNKLMHLDFKQFIQKPKGTGFPFISDLISLNKTYGIYSTKNITALLSVLLKNKNVTTFKDLKLDDGSYKIKIIASDLTNQKMIVLPEDLKNYGLNPDLFSVAQAVAMSISIPLLFTPFVLIDSNGKENYIADGLLYCNYPIWAFDSDETQTIGFNFQKGKNKKADSLNIISYIKLIINAMLDSQCNDGNRKQSEILILTDVNGKNIRATDFALSQQEKELLCENGAKAARLFISHTII